LREGIAQSQYCSWSKEFREAGKKRLAGDPILIAKIEKEKSTYS
jgi:transposase